MSAIDRSGYSLGRLALVGVGIVVLVVAITTASAIAPLADAIDALVELAGHDYVIAAVLGALAVLAGLVVFTSGRGATMDQFEMPDVERPVPAVSAGTPFDETIASWRFATPYVGRADRTRVRERLRTAAVAAVAADEGCSRREARDRVAAGTWTSDAVAASFLAGERPTLGNWLVAATYRETGPAYQARRTVEAILDRGSGWSPTDHGEPDRLAAGGDELEREHR